MNRSFGPWLTKLENAGFFKCKLENCKYAEKLGDLTKSILSSEVKFENQIGRVCNLQLHKLM